MDVIAKFSLKIKTKLFCYCTHDAVCPICQAGAGTLPILNHEALKKLITAAVTLECKLNMASFFRVPAYCDKKVGYIRSMRPSPLGMFGKYGIKSVYLEESPVLYNGIICGGTPLICLRFARPDPNALREITVIFKDNDLVSGEPAISYYDEERELTVIDDAHHMPCAMPDRIASISRAKGFFTPDGFYDASYYPIEHELDMCFIHIDPYTAEQVLSGKDILQGPRGI